MKEYQASLKGGKFASRKNYSFIVVLSIISILLIAGCATTPKSLSPEFLNNIDNLAIFINHKGDELQVLDHTNVWGKTYTGGQFGALGGFLEGLILTTESKTKINKSLGGDPDLLRNSVEDIVIENIIYEKVKDRFSENYIVFNARDIKENKNIDDSTNEHKVEMALSNCREAGIETLIEINFVYGLAAYVGESSSAVIDADVEVWDISSNKSQIKKSILSDYLFKNGHKIDEFIDDNSKIFKEDIDKAADSLALQIASMFEIDVEEKNSKIIDDTIRSFSLKCYKPYNLSQDCSNTLGAKREIEISGRKMNIAGSNDGKVILIMDDKPFSNALVAGFTLGINDKITNETVKCAEVACSFLLSQNINVIKKKKIISQSSIDGYILELDKDGYSILIEYSSNKGRGKKVF